jgi:hypothetical protein
LHHIKACYPVSKEKASVVVVDMSGNDDEEKDDVQENYGVNMTPCATSNASHKATGKIKKSKMLSFDEADDADTTYAKAMHNTSIRCKRLVRKGSE